MLGILFPYVAVMELTQGFSQIGHNRANRLTIPKWKKCILGCQIKATASWSYGTLEGLFQAKYVWKEPPGLIFDMFF